MHSQVPSSKECSIGKRGGSGADLEEFAKLNRDDLMKKKLGSNERIYYRCLIKIYFM